MQEQHADRAALFKQWKGFEWPILVDSFNLLGVKAVPYFWGVDEAGTFVKKFSARKPQPFEAFIKRPSVAFDPPNAMPQQSPRKVSGSGGNPLSQVDQTMSELLFLSRDTRRKKDSSPLGAWIDSLDSLKSNLSASEAKQLNFRIGVAYRQRWESPYGEASDFQSAVTHWQMALAAEPSQYIWRRRIEQYGPRLDKPYPFYDWVVQANREIRDRGETPLRLHTPPSGAEIARPAKDIYAKSSSRLVPLIKAEEAKGLLEDSGGVIQLVSVAVPNAKTKGSIWRVHLIFTPIHGKWDDELRDISLFLPDLEGVAIGPATRELDTTSDLGRVQIEFEVQLSSARQKQLTTIKGLATYHACDNHEGVCALWSQALEITLGKASKK